MSLHGGPEDPLPGIMILLGTIAFVAFLIVAVANL